MLISCFLPLVGYPDIDLSWSMWNIAGGAEKEIEGGFKAKIEGSAISYLYIVLAAGALFFTWTDNLKFARIAFGAVLVLFLIQYFTGVTVDDVKESKGDLTLKDVTIINSDIFDVAKIGLWLLLGSAAAGGFFSKE